MATWSKDELRKIAEADDLHVSRFRNDGVTYGTPTWIWSVAVDGDLYVRAYNGQRSRWYQAATRKKAGRIPLISSETWSLWQAPTSLKTRPPLTTYLTT